MEAQGESVKALDYYQAALAQGSRDALLEAARLCVNPRNEMFDFKEAWHLYQKAAEDAETEADEEAVQKNGTAARRSCRWRSAWPA